MKPIEPILIEKRENVSNELVPLDTAIIKRIGFIIKSTMRECGWTFSTWHTIGESEYVCDIDRALRKGSLNMNTILLCGLYAADGNGTAISEISINGKLYNIFDKLPRRWLFEDFKKELIEAAKLGREFKNKKESLIKAAKAKLSNKEKRALNI